MLDNCVTETIQAECIGLSQLVFVHKYMEIGRSSHRLTSEHNCSIIMYNPMMCCAPSVNSMSTNKLSKNNPHETVCTIMQNQKCQSLNVTICHPLNLRAVKTHAKRYGRTSQRSKSTRQNPCYRFTRLCLRFRP